MKLNSDFLLCCVEQRLDDAVQYGVTRAWKHSDMQPPSEAQVDVICDSVRSALYEIFDTEVEDEL